MQALSLVSLPPPQDLEQELHEPHSAHLHSAGWGRKWAMGIDLKLRHSALYDRQAE